MMQPKKTKFAKFQKIRVSGTAQKCNSVAYGSYGLVVGENIKMSGKELESMRKVIRPVGTRMGGGKSGVESWIAPLKKGTIIVEVDNVSESVAMEALSKAKFKISIPCFIIKRKFAYIN